MRDLDLIREIAQRQSRRATGSNQFLGRHHVAQSLEAGFESQLIQLPVDVSSLNDMQTAGGLFLFQLGYSALDGPDPLG